jgi:hypothetical protein
VEDALGLKNEQATPGQVRDGELAQAKDLVHEPPRPLDWGQTSDAARSETKSPTSSDNQEKA